MSFLLLLLRLSLSGPADPLGSDDYETREAATARLLAGSPFTLPAAYASSASPDPEVRRRAEYVLAEAWPAYPRAFGLAWRRNCARWLLDEDFYEPGPAWAFSPASRAVRSSSLPCWLSDEVYYWAFADPVLYGQLVLECQARGIHEPWRMPDPSSWSDPDNGYGWTTYLYYARLRARRLAPQHTERDDDP